LDEETVFDEVEAEEGDGTELVIKEGLIVVTDSEGEPVEGVSSYMALNGRSVLHYIFNADLTPNETYTVTVPEGLKSDEGAEMTGDFEFTFVPRKQETTVVQVVNDFNTSKGEWQHQGFSGSTLWVMDRAAGFLIDKDVLATTDNTGSASLTYQWNANYSPTAGDPNYSNTVGPMRLRMVAHNSIPSDFPKFSKDDVLQYYLFGDGSNNMFRLCLREGTAGPIFSNVPFALDWVGWKLITWDLANDPVAYWLVAEGPWPVGKVLHMSCLGIEPAPENIRTYKPTTIWMSQLQAVNLGDVVGAYKVSFNTMGGSNIPPIYVNEGEELPAIYFEIDDLAGWYTDPAFTTQWQPTDKVTQNVTLYAKWATVYKVEFISEGEVYLTIDEAPANVVIAKPTDPVRAGYAFDGWFKDEEFAEAWNFATDIITGDLKLYAKWGKTWVVTFDTGDGSDIPSRIIRDGDKVAEPAPPTYSGHTFGGWLLGEVAYIFDAPVTEDITLVAKWDKNSYNVTFNLNYDGAPEPTVVPVLYGDPVAKPEDPKRDGYTFKFWSVTQTSNTEYNFATLITAARPLYAQWEEIVLPPEKYTVTFDSQGGSAVAPQEVEEGQLATKPNDPTKEGHTFGGWFKEAACTNPWNFGGETITKDETLYAKWTVNTYNVSFNTGAGTPVPNATVAHGDKVTKPADPTRTNYAFDGWFTEAECINAYDFNAAVTGGFTLYAKWKTITISEILDALSVKVYPNPTDGLFTVEFAVEATYIVTITDMAGKALLKQTVSDLTTQIDISSFSEGVYMLVINDGKNQVVTRIIKK